MTQARPCLLREYVCFYSGCVPTHAGSGGVLCITGNDPTKPVFWFHGPRKAGAVGGAPWPQPGSACAFPVLGARLLVNKRLLETMVQMGYRDAWGYAKLLPVTFVG
jgi:hypothetical protein